MKLSWFGLFPLYQVSSTHKKERKVEKTCESSKGKNEKEKDTYEFTIKKENKDNSY